MGTYYTRGATRADIIKELLEVSAPRTGDDGNVRARRVLDHAVVGSILYTLECQTLNGHPMPAWIGVTLLTSCGGDAGYKPMDESMGPYYYTCPLRIIDAADAPVNELARAWREKVRAYHAARRTKAAANRAKLAEIRPGVTLRLPEGFAVRSIRVYSVDGRRIVGQTDAGRLYLMTPRSIAAAEVIPATDSAS